MKMSKGYQWEISLLPEEGILLIDKDFERLENRNKKLEETYGTK